MTSSTSSKKPDTQSLVQILSRRRLLTVTLLLIGLTAAGLQIFAKAAGTVAESKTGFVAVALTSGQIFMGKISNLDSAWPTLDEVYYVHAQQDPQTKEMKNVLIKRGGEWHSPDKMLLNARQILIIEPVAEKSKAMELIQQLGQRVGPAAN